jgi:hypothetical protein
MGMTKADLERVREWANTKLATGEEPPWAWYQYMKLRETLDAILAGMAAVSPTESSQQSGSRPGAHLRLVDSTGSQDTVPPRLEIERPQLPM